MNKQNAIAHLYDSAVKAKTTLIREVIGTVTQRQLNDIKAAGIELSDDYVHTLDNYAIIHSLRKHGNKQMEQLRGQVAITKQDFERIPDVLNDYDSIFFDKNDRGQDVIIYKKAYEDGSNLYAEEVRVGRKELAMASMYKTKGTFL
jgi:hypothetical protein